MAANGTTILHLILLCFALSSDALSFLKQKNLKLDRMVKCDVEKNLTLHAEDIVLFTRKKITYINAKVVCDEDTSTNLKVEVNLNRCKAREQGDTCEFFQKFRAKMCDMLKGKHQPWTPFLEKVEPAYRCPFRKGVYTLTNGTFDGGAYSSMGNIMGEGYYWKIEVKVFDEVVKRQIMCLLVEGQLVNI